MRKTITGLLAALALIFALAAPAVGQSTGHSPTQYLDHAPWPPTGPTGTPRQAVRMRFEVLNPNGIFLYGMDQIQRLTAPPGSVTQPIAIDIATQNFPNGTTDRWLSKPTGTAAIIHRVRVDFTDQQLNQAWEGMFLPPGIYALNVTMGPSNQMMVINYPVAGGTPEVRNSDILIYANSCFDDTGAPALLQGQFRYSIANAATSALSDEVSNVANSGFAMPLAPRTSTPARAPSGPVQGQNFTVAVYNDQSILNATYAELMIGFSLPSTSIALPPGLAHSAFDRVRLVVDSSVPMSTPTFSFTWEATLAIPSDPALTGLPVYFQAIGFSATKACTSHLVATRL